MKTERNTSQVAGAQYGHGCDHPLRSIFRIHGADRLTDISIPGGLVQILIETNGNAGIATRVADGEWRVIAVNGAGTTCCPSTTLGSVKTAIAFVSKNWR